MIHSLSCDNSLDYFILFRLQDVSNLLYALAKLRFRPSDSWIEAMLRSVPPKLMSFSPQHLANTLWAIGRLGIKPGLPWMLTFESAVRSREGSLEPREARQIRDALVAIYSPPLATSPSPGVQSNIASSISYFFVSNLTFVSVSHLVHTGK